MKNVVLNKSILIGFVLIANLAVGQRKSEQLKAEQSKIESKLSTTQSLLEKVRKGTQSSISELQLIDVQVKSRERLVQNVDNQIRGAELTISSKSKQITQLTERIERLKQQYKKMLLYAYKHRNRYNKMMYIFSSSNYFEAVKRNNYLKRIAEIQQKQFKVIQQNQLTIKKEITVISDEKLSKQELLSLKIKEKEQILKDKELKQSALAKLQKDESQLMADLKKTQREREELKRKIKNAIEKEIAEAEAKAKKEREKAAALAAKNKPKTDPKVTPTKTDETPKVKEETEIVLADTKENIALGKSFETNRGKLPWPVAKGTITEAYGKNAHPTLAGVYTNNNGIDIGATKNAQVRAVFEGEVTSVFTILGAGKVVIIKHGNYRTVYSNLQEVTVSQGMKVSTKQVIGSLLPDENNKLSTAHFEIHQVVDGSVQRINPSLWLAQ